MKFAYAIAALLVAVSATAEASGADDKKKKDDAGQYVAISPVAIPVVSGGKVVNYVFTSVRIDLTNSANVVKLREREPYFRDALVRAAHRTPFTLPSDLTKIDEAKLKAAVLRDATAIAGPNAIKGVQITNQAAKSLRVNAR